MYSEEQLYQLIGEKNSMKRLLTEVRGSAGPPQPCRLLPFPLWAEGFAGRAALLPSTPVHTGAPSLTSSLWRGRATLSHHSTPQSAKM